jgi:DNA-directed RNA polymerase subunit H
LVTAESLPPKVVLEHELVPKHEILSKKDADKLLEEFGIKSTQLPKIRVDDPVTKALKAKKKDIIKITRDSATAGEAVYYRIVI